MIVRVAVIPVINPAIYREIREIEEKLQWKYDPFERKLLYESLAWKRYNIIEARMLGAETGQR